MGDLQLENVPDELRERLLRQAIRREMSLDDVIVAALERELDRIEFYDRLEAKEPMEFEVSPSELLAQERARRDAIF